MIIAAAIFAGLALGFAIHTSIMLRQMSSDSARRAAEIRRIANGR